jgi:hypothetical protein
MTKAKHDTRKAFLDYYVYAPLGAGQLLIEKTRALGAKAVETAKAQRENASDSYRDLAGRGEKIVSSIRRSVYTKRAVDQAKTARTQVKAAATSIRKSAGTTAEATKVAAKKVG